jgi:dephospho-CoA kinase
MLEHMGAYGIDADSLAHRAIAKGAPAYQPVIEIFGKYILDPDGQINRTKLARLTFGDQEAITQLERIVHPLVEQATDLIIRRSNQPVIVIEAIKLLESSLHSYCDSIWVVYAPSEIQLTRLVQKRHMTEVEARQRMEAQPSQESKMAAANVVIRNVASYEDTWRQLTAAWQKFVPAGESAPEAAAPQAPISYGEMVTQRGKPRHSDEIAEFINRIQKANPPIGRAEIMAAFGEKAFLLLEAGTKLVGVVGLQVENLVARTIDMIIDPAVPVNLALPIIVSDIERASRDLQCEASLIFVPHDLGQYELLWKSLGYERRAPQNLGILAWQEAALESQPPGTDLFFKQLRQDRILRPI